MATIVLLASMPLVQAGAAGAIAEARGFRYVGEIPEPASGGKSDSALGALFVDPVHRLGLVWRGAVDSPTGTTRVWDAYDLDTFGGDRAAKRGEIVFGSGGTADPQRLVVDELTTEPIMVIDPPGHRVMYHAKGAIYEVQYDPDQLDPAEQTLSKWVAAPNPGGLSGNLPSGPNTQQRNTFDPLGMMYWDQGDEPRLYVVGTLRSEGAVPGFEGLVISAWDATPGNGSTSVPERRDLWTYVSHTCRRSINRDPNGRALVMRTPDALYLACDASPDGTAKGLLRLELSRSNALASDEMAPTGVEEFFPGIVGAEVEVYGDSYPVQEEGTVERRDRIYALSRNLAGRSRRALVFDSSVGASGAYAGVFPVVNPPDPPRNAQGVLISPGPAAGAVDPTTGRWYFQGPDGLRYQDGRLATVTQSATVASDLDHPNESLLTGAAERAPRVDPGPAGGRPPRVLIWHSSGEREHAGGAKSQCVDPAHACWKIYEDTNPRIDVTPSVDEFTLNVPESDETSGAFAGTTSAYGVRTRFVRGLSSFWPSSIAGQGGLEQPPNNSPPSSFPSDWQRDPFYYQAGDCYASDFEVTLSRVFESVLDSDGVESDGASARSLAADPDAHRKNQDDDQTLRRELAHPDPTPTSTTTTTLPPGTDPEENPPRAEPGEGCVRQFLETMAHPQMPNESDPEDGDLDFLGQAWPYRAAACAHEGTAEEHVTPQDANWGTMAPLALSGDARVTCAAGRDTASLHALARTTLSPSESAPIVTVREVVSETSSERPERNGLRSTATVVVRGLTLFGSIGIEEVRTTATVHAPGYRRVKGGDQAEVDATRSFERTFLGLSVTDPATGETTPVCTVCEDTQVVSAINAALGSNGYARAPEPDPDYKLGTSKGTNAVVQKDRLQQAADLIGNSDDSNEWPALEVVVYRDAEQRGSGRWIVQIGGVFSQARFSVIGRLGDLVDDPSEDEPIVEDAPEDSDGTFIEGSIVEGTPGSRVAIRVGGAEPASSVGAAASPPRDGGVLGPIVKALRSLTGALLLLLIWLLVFGPIYVARRRALLHRVVSP